METVDVGIVAYFRLYEMLSAVLLVYIEPLMISVMFQVLAAIDLNFFLVLT